MSKNNTFSESKAEPVNIPQASKLQALLLGCILLISYILKLIPIIIIVALISLIALILGRTEINFLKLSQNRGAHLFTSAIVTILLVLAILLLYKDFSLIGWIVVIIVAALLLFAGTTGFCFASFSYIKIFNKS